MFGIKKCPDCGIFACEKCSKEYAKKDIMLDAEEEELE